MKENENLTDEQKLDRAEEYFNGGLTDKAQSILNEVQTESGRKYYIQSEIYRSMRWYTEQRKQLKKAIKAEPNNEEYKKKLEDLNRVAKTDSFREMEKSEKEERLCGACCDGCADGFMGC